jgi:phosphatidate phosphatase APP1
VVKAVLPLMLMLLAAAPAAARQRPAVIVFYNGLGTPAAARLWGRVLADKEPGKATASESRWRKIKRTWHELDSDEVRNAELEVKVLNRTLAIKADNEGLFKVDLKGPLAVGQHAVTGVLKGPRRHRVEEGRLLIWPARGTVVVSDIDDTVLQTGVTNKLKMFKRVLFSNAHDLKTYDHAAALYRTWSKHGHPIVFVSGSPVNLYTRLKQFLALRGFPTSVLLLKNLGLEKGADALTDQIGYKQRRIREVLELLPGYKLLCVGDTGEKDPEIYAKVRAANRALVTEVMIHRVTQEEKISPRFQGQIVFDTYLDLANELRRRKHLTPSEVKALARSLSADKTP